MMPFSSAADFRRGFLVTSVNPKAIVFYMAFFPLFIDPLKHQGVVTFATMMLIIATQTLLYGSVLVLVGNNVASLFRSRPLLGQVASRLAGATLILFGIRLARD